MTTFRNLGLGAIGALLLTGPVLAVTPIEVVRFAPGTTGTTLTGSVIRGERKVYGLTARAGQTMVLTIAALEDNAVFQVYAPGARVNGDGVTVTGQALPGASVANETTQWQGKLPRSGQYLVVVGGTRGNASYVLDVTIR